MRAVGQRRAATSCMLVRWAGRVLRVDAPLREVEAASRILGDPLAVDLVAAPVPRRRRPLRRDGGSVDGVEHAADVHLVGGAGGEAWERRGVR